MAQANIKAVITAEDRASAALSGFGSKVNKLGTQLASVAKKAAFALGAASVAAATFGIKTAADFETARSALIGLLGSAKEADKTMARIKREAAATPFELTGLTEGVKQLSSVSKSGDEAIDILLSVGKAVTASGGGQFELDRVVFNLKQIKGIGQLSAIDLKELRRAIPIFDKLVEAAGTSVEEIQNAKDPAKALFDVFEKGGKKLEAVDKAFINQGGNFNQILSNMKDNLAIFTSDFVRATGIFDIAKRAIKGVSDVLGNNKDSLINGFNQSIKTIGEVGRQVSNYLGPKLEALWNTISQRLIPTLNEFWKRYLEPLIPVIGVLLVGAIGLALDTVNFLITAFDGLMDQFLEGNPIIVGLTALFGTLALAMAMQSGFRAITAGFALLTNTTIPGVKLKLIALRALIASPIGFGAIAIAAALIALAKVKKAADEARRAIQGADTAARSAADSQGSSIGRLRDLVRNGTPEQQKRAREVLKRMSAGGLHTGTSFSPGGTHMVGERGPEMVSLPRGSKVLPADKTAKMSGGQTINFNVNIGMYAGSEMEKRKVAKALFDAYNDLTRANLTGMRT